jgi:two-component system, cell cycle sensor histidine kinase and response regulator CckA
MISQRLRQIRQQKGLTLEQLAAVSGLNRGTIHRIELKRVSPRLDTLELLCKALGTDLLSLVQGDGSVPVGPKVTPQPPPGRKGASGIRHGALDWLEHVEALIQCSVDALMVLDPDGLVVYESQSAARMFSPDPETRRTLPWWLWTHPDDRQALRAALRGLEDTPDLPVSVEYRVRRRNGTWRWLRSSLSNEFDHPWIRGVIVNTQNISRLKQLELDLKSSEARLRAIVDALPDGYARIRKDGTILDLRTDGMGTYLPSDFAAAGRNLSELPFPKDLLETLMDLVGRALATGDIQTTVFRAGSEGRERLREIRVSPSGSSEVLALFRDVTDQKFAERLRYNAERLEGLGTMMSGVTHRFSNLLMGIQGHMELAQRRAAAGDPLLPHLEKAQEGMGRATQLLDQLRGFAGYPVVLRKPMDLNALIEAIRPSIEGMKGAQHRLEFDLAADLPILEADPSLLERLVLDLVSNAFESMSDRPGTVRLSTRSAPAEHGTPRITLEVADEGCGIDPDILGRIFDPFFSTKFTGRGMGLSAAQGIVKAHEGEIEVESELSKGSRFLVSLPVSQVGAVVLPGRDPIHPRLPSFKAILVAEDDEELLACLESILEDLGYRAILARNGREAVEAYRVHQNAIGLVLLDLNMPVMNGREAYYAIRGINPEAKIVLSTGSCEDVFGHTSEATNIAGLLFKPYSLEDLRQVLSGVH